jgi:hypothetical protein
MAPATFILVILLLLFPGICSLVPHTLNLSSFSDNLQERLANAANYIEKRYDARVGLVSESEDTGSNVPDGTPCNRTFWVYDDNLWASEALKPFQAEMARNISATVARYIAICGSSELFEVVLGTEIPTPIHARRVISVDSFIYNSLNYTVWADRHRPEDGGIFYDADQYADLCFYLSLNYAIVRNKVASERWFRIGESFWDGHGFLDKAAKNDGHYQNYKLGLYLFTARATGFNSSIFTAVENIAWSCQEPNGGIASRSNLNSTYVGTANVETTSILLLAYDKEAIARFSNMNSLKIGAYYYTWYGISSNEHWDQGVKYMPLLGRYNSSDPAVADEHILLAKQHGIDFFAVSWIGKGDWTKPDVDFRYVDQNLANGLLKAPHLENFTFCLVYETVLVLNETINEHKNFTDVFLNDLKYAANQYFTNPSYLRIDNKPVLFMYQLPFLYRESPVSVKELLDAARKQLENTGVYLVGDVGSSASINDVNATWLYSMDAITTYHYLDTSNRWDQILGNASANYPVWLRTLNSSGIRFIPNAYPGFDNTENCRYKIEHNQTSGSGTVLPLNEIMFKQMLDVAINYSDSDPKIVMITSWNEWLESTAIEPSVEYGELLLNQVSNVVPEFPSNILVFLFMLAVFAIIVHRKKVLSRSSKTSRI